jgi:hypothetical protein
VGVADEKDFAHSILLKYVTNGKWRVKSSCLEVKKYSILSEYPAEYPTILDIAKSVSLNTLLYGFRRRMRMLGIAVILVSFVVAVLGLLHSHAAKPGEAATWGLTRLGLILLVVSFIGLLVGVAKEVATLRSGAEAKEWQVRTTEQLKKIDADLRGAQARVADPDVAAQLGRLADHISATASRSRSSDFSMSDFTNSNFRYGNFTRASFQGALFRDADLRGADMSTALIDAETKLPAKR